MENGDYNAIVTGNALDWPGHCPHNNRASNGPLNARERYPTMKIIDPYQASIDMRIRKLQSTERSMVRAHKRAERRIAEHKRKHATGKQGMVSGLSRVKREADDIAAILQGFRAAMQLIGE